MLSLQKQKIQPLQVADVLQEKGIILFTSRDFSRIFRTSARQTRYFLESYTKRDFLVRLKKDVYTLKMKLPEEEIIANALYRPSYLSLEYALSRYGIIPESVYSITSVTTKATAFFVSLGKEFSYQKIKKEAYTGYIPEKRNNKVFLIAEPEKALVDYLYFVSVGRKTFNDRIDCSRLDKEKAFQYGALFQRKTIKDLIQQAFTNDPGIIK